MVLIKNGSNTTRKKNASRRIKSSEQKKDTDTILLQFERDVAPLGAIACWNLRFWDKMKTFVQKTNVNNNFEGAFLRSILSVHDNDRQEALFWIEKCREFLDLKFTSIIVDDYENIYPLCVKAQQLIELKRYYYIKMQNYIIILKNVNRKQCEYK